LNHGIELLRGGDDDVVPVTAPDPKTSSNTIV
jgi:hypothetical protein